MMRRTKAICLLLGFIFLLGCETTKGMVNDIKTIPRYAKKGWNAIERADAWVRKNLW